MTVEQIRELINDGQLPTGMMNPKLVETHISWVLIGEEWVYKVKKPVQYSFLDFSTLEKRKYYCQREIVLNSRFTSGIYLDVVTINDVNGQLVLEGGNGTVIDYAVKMQKLDPRRRMDLLLNENKVSESDMIDLAKKIAGFHQEAEIKDQLDPDEIAEKFNDLEGQSVYLEQLLPGSLANISKAIKVSNKILKQNLERIKQRIELGFVRDCHGDLHTRNIFLLPEPTPFDCLEFNDSYRYMDVLDEVAFLCMDLDALGRRDLAVLLLHHYDQSYHTLFYDEDRRMFIYYKAYRANVRAKVNSLRAAGSPNEKARTAALGEVRKYLELMNVYIRQL